METFFACWFEEFSINEKLTTKELKINSENFLREKLKINKKNLKKITITKIIERGGNTKNALRYKDRFGILDLLK